MTLAGRAVQKLFNSTLQRELDGNLYCLRLFASEPRNGIAQSDMHIAPTTPVETKSPPMEDANITLLSYFVNSMIYNTTIFGEYYGKSKTTR